MRNLKPDTWLALAITVAMFAAFFVGRFTCESELRVKPGQAYAGGLVTAVTLHIDGSQEAIVSMPDGNVHRFIVERPK